MDWTKPNLIRDKVAETDEFTMYPSFILILMSSKEFATEYAQQLMAYNNHYLDLLDTKNQLIDTIQMLENNQYQ